MPIIVIDGKVRHSNITYEIGEIVEGLSEMDESRLVSLNVAKYVDLEENLDKIPSDLNKDPVVIPDDEENTDNTEISPDDEENTDNIIDLNSLALNPDDYVNASVDKTKKEKAI